MGYYIGANELRKGLAARASISLDTAVLRFSRWDVFLSHKSRDAPKAIRIAERVSSNGLSVWVDVADPNISGDGPQLADYIRRVLSSSRSLLALITGTTNESWWVPFEIGMAYDQEKLLASYGSRVHLPSFLYKWPNVQTDSQLDQWCHELRTSTKGVSFARQMRTLTSRF